MTELLPITDILMPPNPPAGMNADVIALWYLRLRNTPDPLSEPIEVTIAGELDTGPIYRISDGRHRYVATLRAGRTHIEAKVIRP